MVKNITYKKKQYPIRLSYRALKVLKGNGRDLTELTKGNFDDSMFEDLLFVGLQSGHKAEDVQGDLELKKEDMEDVLDECFLEFVKLLPEFFPKQIKAAPGNESPNQALPNEEDQKRPALVVTTEIA